MSIVAGDVVVGTVPVVLAICPVVLVVVRDEVAQGKAVMRRHEVDAGIGLSPIRLVEIGGASEAIAQVGDPALVAMPEVADAIAELPIPFRPTRGKSADVVAVLADIPRLRNQLYPGQHRILVDSIEERSLTVDV